MDTDETLSVMQALPERMSFEEFLEWYPESGRRYELHNGIGYCQLNGINSKIGMMIPESLAWLILSSRI
jgi:Uma2 family endonuclease